MPLSALETVVTDTPATLATSWIVGRLESVVGVGTRRKGSARLAERPAACGRCAADTQSSSSSGRGPIALRLVGAVSARGGDDPDAVSLLASVMAEADGVAVADEFAPNWRNRSPRQSPTGRRGA